MDVNALEGHGGMPAPLCCDVLWRAWLWLHAISSGGCRCAAGLLRALPRPQHAAGAARVLPRCMLALPHDTTRQGAPGLFIVVTLSIGLRRWVCWRFKEAALVAAWQ